MRKGLVVLLVAFVGYVALSAYVVANQGIDQLLVCVDKGGLKIPFSKSVCRQYLFSARGSKQDIDTLHQGIGASFVVQGESPAAERDQVLKFLIAKGLDVNHIDMHKLSPLHAAVLANSPDEVALLLRNGADTRLKDQKFRLTPLELALKLQSEDKSPNDRLAVISLLKSAQQRRSEEPQLGGRIGVGRIGIGLENRFSVLAKPPMNQTKVVTWFR